MGKVRKKDWPSVVVSSSAFAALLLTGYVIRGRRCGWQSPKDALLSIALSSLPASGSVPFIMAIHSSFCRRLDTGYAVLIQGGPKSETKNRELKTARGHKMPPPLHLSHIRCKWHTKRRNKRTEE